MVSKRFEVSQRVWAFSFSRLPTRICVEHVPGEGKSLLQIQIQPSAGVPRELCVDLERDQRQIAEDREIADRIERIKRKNGSKPWNLIPNDRNLDLYYWKQVVFVVPNPRITTAEIQSTQQEEDLRGIRDRKATAGRGKGFRDSRLQLASKSKKRRGLARYMKATISTASSRISSAKIKPSIPVH
jgi:hypothetical protein